MSIDKYPMRIGYACLNTHLREHGIFTSRSLILKTAATKGIEYIKNLAIQNIDDLMTILIYNEAHGIRFYRLSSCIFPHQVNPRLQNDSGFNYDLSFIKHKLKTIGDYAKLHGHRITMHPGQYVQLGSPDPAVVKQSILELENHTYLLRTMGLDCTHGSVLIIHGGGTYGDKQQTLKRWQQVFDSLPNNIKNYISLENDEFNYSVMDLLPFCEQNNIPFCLDLFHNKISKERVTITKKLIKRIFATWHKRQIIPKVHISEQQPGLRLGAHSKTIEKIPTFLLRIPHILKTPLDIMLEVKDKEVSVFKIYYKYFTINMDQTGKIYYTRKK